MFAWKMMTLVNAKASMTLMESCLAQWSLNDAHWSGEYMEGLMSALGIVVEDGDKKLEKKFKKEMMELYGY